jgi:hypothetical protein
MSDNVIKLFSGKESSTRSSEEDWSTFRPRNKGSRRNLRFLGKDLILESDDADLIHDVSCNIDRAQVKLRLISKRLAGLKQQSAVEIEKLTAAEIKLRAAIVAAQEKKANPPARVHKLAAAPETLQEKLARLSESDREVIRKIVEQFVEGA